MRDKTGLIIGSAVLICILFSSCKDNKNGRQAPISLATSAEFIKDSCGCLGYRNRLVNDSFAIFDSCFIGYNIDELTPLLGTPSWISEDGYSCSYFINCACESGKLKRESSATQILIEFDDHKRVRGASIIMP